MKINRQMRAALAAAVTVGTATIDGVMNASRGKPCAVISEFRMMMGI